MCGSDSVRVGSWILDVLVNEILVFSLMFFVSYIDVDRSSDHSGSLLSSSFPHSLKGHQNHRLQ